MQGAMRAKHRFERNVLRSCGWGPRKLKLLDDMMNQCTRRLSRVASHFLAPHFCTTASTTNPFHIHELVLGDSQEGWQQAGFAVDEGWQHEQLVFWTTARFVWLQRATGCLKLYSVPVPAATPTPPSIFQVSTLKSFKCQHPQPIRWPPRRLTQILPRDWVNWSSTRNV